MVTFAKRADSNRFSLAFTRQLVSDFSGGVSQEEVLRIF